MCGLCWKLERLDLDVDAFTHETADLISKLFGIGSVAIGARNPVDGLYKSKVVVGLDKDVADGFKKLTYTRAQLLETSKYPCYEISDHTKLFLAEDHPYADGEEFTYRRPRLIGMKRRALTERLDADNVDFFFNGSDGNILGFIETSGTRMRKFPDS